MDLINCIWQGLLTGIVLSLMLGTVFFSLIRNSIAYGYKTGIYIAGGVVLCDIMFIALALMSSSFADFLKEYESEVSIGGGIILIVMGILMFVRSKPKDTEGKVFSSSGSDILYYIGNGFLLNVLNPVNFFSWLAISSVLRIEYNYGLKEQSVYFSASLVSIFLVEIGIAYFASMLKKKVTDKVVQRINQISGIVFFLLGLKLLTGF